jgi:hypothetical protein
MNSLAVATVPPVMLSLIFPLVVASTGTRWEPRPMTDHQFITFFFEERSSLSHSSAGAQD